MKTSGLAGIVVGTLVPIAATASVMPPFGDMADPTSTETRSGMAPGLGTALIQSLASPEAGSRVKPETSGSPTQSPAAWIARLCGEAWPPGGSSTIRVCSAVHVPTNGDTPLAALVRSLKPLEEPLSRLLPDDALAAWDLEAPPAAVADLAAQVLEEVGPGQHRWLEDRLSELRAAGLDPATELLPALGHGLGGGLLPPAPGDATWRLPRPVWLLRVEDEHAVARVLPELLRWWAGAVADLSGGLTSAALVREEIWDVSVSGLQIEGVFEAPLPSPAVAMTGGVLIVSPVRSAVRDVVVEISSRAALDRPDGITAPPGAVGLLRAKPRALAVLLDSALPRLARLASAAGLPVGGLGAEPTERLARALLRLAGSFEQVTASATLVPGEDGAWLVLEREVRLAHGL